MLQIIHHNEDLKHATWSSLHCNSMYLYQTSLQASMCRVLHTQPVHMNSNKRAVLTCSLACCMYDNMLYRGDSVQLLYVYADTMNKG